jgi:hypothetical protein
MSVNILVTDKINTEYRTNSLQNPTLSGDPKLVDVSNCYQLNLRSDPREHFTELFN